MDYFEAIRLAMIAGRWFQAYSTAPRANALGVIVSAGASLR
ncbi:MAG: hypothetical protein ACYTG5_11985 [Planctomycetota bacterium]|jgi:hypothetical protein